MPLQFAFCFYFLIILNYAQAVSNICVNLLHKCHSIMIVVQYRYVNHMFSFIFFVTFDLPLDVPMHVSCCW